MDLARLGTIAGSPTNFFLHILKADIIWHHLRGVPHMWVPFCKITYTPNFIETLLGGSTVHGVLAICHLVEVPRRIEKPQTAGMYVSAARDVRQRQPYRITAV